MLLYNINLWIQLNKNIAEGYEVNESNVVIKYIVEEALHILLYWKYAEQYTQDQFKKELNMIYDNEEASTLYIALTTLFNEIEVSFELEFSYLNCYLEETLFIEEYKKYFDAQDLDHVIDLMLAKTTLYDNMIIKCLNIRKIALTTEQLLNDYFDELAE